jgi:hypothetical protein
MKCNFAFFFVLFFFCNEIKFFSTKILKLGSEWGSQYSNSRDIGSSGMNQMDRQR